MNKERDRQTERHSIVKRVSCHPPPDIGELSNSGWPYSSGELGIIE
jgi:hypothetical protein